MNAPHDGVAVIGPESSQGSQDQHVERALEQIGSFPIFRGHGDGLPLVVLWKYGEHYPRMSRGESRTCAVTFKSAQRSLTKQRHFCQHQRPDRAIAASVPSSD